MILCSKCLIFTFIIALMLHVFSENEGLLNYGTIKPQKVKSFLNNIMIMIIIKT